MMITRTMIVGAAAAALFAAAACGGGGSSSGGGSTPTTPSPTPTPGAATITITSSGASPRTVTVSLGSRVTFVNQDTRSHDMSSDPHPSHTDCPALNDVGFLTPNQTKASGNLTTARTCRFHDHDQPTNQSLQGSIVIQ